jgi:plastocyanin
MDVDVRQIFVVLLLSIASGAGDIALASEAFSIRVVDREGRPVVGAAVVIPASVPAQAVDARAVMDQRNRRFRPDLLIVQAGTTVSFPNNDTVMHHVYSFSDPKMFELPLYQANVAPPITFDIPGMVVLGCNIHDQMIGHILVVDTANFGRTDERGIASLTRTAETEQVLVWRRVGFGYEPLRFLLQAPIGDSVTIRLEEEDRTLAETQGGSLQWHADY